MPKANDLKKGMIVQVDGKPHIVRRSESKSPSSRGAATLYKIRLNCLLTQQKIDLSLKGDDYLHEADCQRAEVQYSYMDGDNYIFMNLTDFSQYSLHSEELEWQTQFLTEQQEEILALLLDGILIGIELPQSVTLVIDDTPPAVTGSSATNRTKTATLSTGIEIQVPEYLSTGESVKVNTSTGKFMSRA
jgi:elongation factor P